MAGFGVNIDTFFSACRLWNSLEYLERYGLEFCWNDQSSLIWSIRCGTFAPTYIHLVDYFDKECKEHFDEYFYGLILKKLKFLRKNNLNFNITNIPVPKVSFICQMFDKIARVLLKKFEELEKPRIPPRSGTLVRNYKPLKYIFPVPSTVIMVPFKYATLEEALTIERKPRCIVEQESAKKNNVALGVMRDINFIINRAISFVFLKEDLDEKQAQQKKLLAANIELEEKLDRIATAAKRDAISEEQTNAFINELVRKYEAEFGIGRYALCSSESSDILQEHQKPKFSEVNLPDEAERKAMELPFLQQKESLATDIANEQQLEVPTIDVHEIPKFVDDILTESCRIFKNTSLDERDRRRKSPRVPVARRLFPTRTSTHSDIPASKAQPKKMAEDNANEHDSFDNHHDDNEGSPEIPTKMEPENVSNTYTSNVEDTDPSQSQTVTAKASEMLDEKDKEQGTPSSQSGIFLLGQENISPKSQQCVDDDLPDSKIANKVALIYDDSSDSSKSCRKPEDITGTPSSSNSLINSHDNLPYSSECCQLAVEMTLKQKPSHFEDIVPQIVETKTSSSTDNTQVVDELIAKLSGKHRHINIMPSFRLGVVPDIEKDNVMATGDDKDWEEDAAFHFSELMKNILKEISAKEDKLNAFCDSSSYDVKPYISVPKQSNKSVIKKQPYLHDTAGASLLDVRDYSEQLSKIMSAFFTPANSCSEQGCDTGFSPLQFKGMLPDPIAKFDSSILEYIKSLVDALPDVNTMHHRSIAKTDSENNTNGNADSRRKRRSNGSNKKRRNKKRRKNDF